MSVKGLALKEEIVDRRDIRKNTEVICLYVQTSDIDGQYPFI
jgi:hypothetical protein